MISRKEVKLIHSLAEKKYRQRENLFIAEGPKVVGDLTERWKPAAVYALEEWIADEGGRRETNATLVTPDELRRISMLKTPQQVLALFPLPEEGKAPDNTGDGHQIILALDSLRDPGNVGTIIRIADWFNITAVMASDDTADAFSPKVVQAAMGSLARVDIIYTHLAEWLGGLTKQPASNILGAFLDGENIYESDISGGGVIIIGNESRGVSPEAALTVTRRISIPLSERDAGRGRPDSLNAAVAAAIICAECRRQQKIIKKA